MKLQGLSFALQGRRTRAVTLIECLVYISLFAMFVVLTMTTFYRALDGSEALRRDAADIARALDAGERWREDVRTASTSPSLLLNQGGRMDLFIPHGTNVTVYTLFNGTIWRQSHTNVMWQPVLTRVKSSSMSADVRTHVAAWRWEVELQIEDARKQTKPLFTFFAVAPTESKP